MYQVLAPVMYDRTTTTLRVPRCTVGPRARRMISTDYLV